MLPNVSLNQQNSEPKEGKEEDNGSPRQPVAGGEAQPLTSVEEVVPNFSAGPVFLTQNRFEPNTTEIARILDSMKLLNPYFDRKTSKLSRNPFKGGGGSQMGGCASELRFAHSLPACDAVLEILKMLLTFSKSYSFKNVDVKVLQCLFGNDEILISSFFSKVMSDQVPELVPIYNMREALGLGIQIDKSLDKSKTFIEMFVPDSKKGRASEKYVENINIFRQFIMRFFLHLANEKFQEGRGTREEVRLEALLCVLKSLNEKTLFGPAKTSLFLYDLAITLLKDLGASVHLLEIDSLEMSKALISILIFRKFYESEDEHQVELFRVLNDCLCKGNSTLLKFCFESESELKTFNLRMTSQSAGLAHNGQLGTESEIKSSLLDPVKIWEQFFDRFSHRIIGWVSPTGSGKTLWSIILSMLFAWKNGYDVVWVGPETETMSPQSMATLIECVKRFLGDLGHEVPRIDLNQTGVMPTNESSCGAVNIFMLSMLDAVFPLLITSEKRRVVIFDDNNLVSPQVVLERLIPFKNVHQIHLSGATMDLTGLAAHNVQFVGDELNTSTSFVSPSFICPHGLLSISPDQYRKILLALAKFKKSNSVGISPLSDDVDLKMAYNAMKELVETLDLSPFPSGTIYTVEDLNRISKKVFQLVKQMNEIGLQFSESDLQYPKPCQSSEMGKVHTEIVNKLHDGHGSLLVFCDLKNAHKTAENLSNLSKNRCAVVESNEENLVQDNVGEVNVVLGGNDSHDDNGNGKLRKGSKHRQVVKGGRVPSAIIKKPDQSSETPKPDDDGNQGSAEDPETVEDKDPENSGKVMKSKEDKDNSLTFEEILNKVNKHSLLFQRVKTLPTNQHIKSAFDVLLESKHPDAPKWLRQFISGVALLEMIMPREFIELCFTMFEEGRMILIIVPELFHLQSWNPKCLRKIIFYILSQIPLNHLLQAIARAGRMGTEMCGIIFCHSDDGMLVLPDVVSASVADVASDASVACVASVASVPDEIGLVQLMSARHGVDWYLKRMLSAGNFSQKEFDFVELFLKVSEFAYLDQSCHHACVGGPSNFKDFIKFISMVLVSGFVSPFEVELPRLDEKLSNLATSDFVKNYHKYDTSEVKDKFVKKVEEVIGSNLCSIAFALLRATGVKKFVGIDRNILPTLFTQLYEAYPRSLISFLKLLKSLLMNLQSSVMCEDRNALSMVRAMLLVVSTMIESVSDILGLLADVLRESDMVVFRKGYKEELSPREQLRRLLKSEQITLAELRLFLDANRQDLPMLCHEMTNILLFLSPHGSSGHYHEIKLRIESLKKDISKNEDSICDEKKKLAKPMGMKPVDWTSFLNSEVFKAQKVISEQVILALTHQNADLTRQIERSLKTIQEIPSSDAEIIAYFKKII